MKLIAGILRVLQVRFVAPDSCFLNTTSDKVYMLTFLRQILFAIVVLGLSISLIKTQADDATPSQTKYAAFCGAWATLMALVGIVGLFFESLPLLIMAALDGLTILLLAAGGIVRIHPYLLISGNFADVADVGTGRGAWSPQLR